MAAPLRPSRVVAALVWLHRWAGILLCGLFALWFASGAVILFVPFPSLADVDRLAGAEPIEAALVRISPTAALAAAPGATTLRLLSVDGRAVYVTAGGAAPVSVIDAATGGVRPPVTPEAAARIGARFGSAQVRRVDADIDYDQWIVHQGFDAGRPFHRISVDDDAGTVLYVSAATGELQQRTTRSERWWNGIGAVLHWLYFTPLRRDWARWDATVWWVSLAGVVVAAAGFTLGTLRFVQARRVRGSGFGWFRGGWLRWHHVLGLTAGITLLTWIFSGWLSMDHGRLFSTSAAEAGAVTAFRGRDLRGAFEDWSAEAVAVRLAGDVRELRFAVVAGEPLLVVRDAAGHSVQVGTAGRATPALPESLLLAAARAAWPGETDLRVEARDAYDLYAAADGVPRDARVLRLPASDRTVYVDATTGDIEAVVDASRRRYAWAYHVFHTGRHPVIAQWEPVRKAVVLLLLGAGFALSATGLVIGWRRLLSRRTD